MADDAGMTSTVTNHPQPPPIPQSRDGNLSPSRGSGSTRTRRGSSDTRHKQSYSIDGGPIHPEMSARAETIAFDPGLGGKHPTGLDDYFTGPVDAAKHSKLPFFMRLHGSIMPKLILPVLFVGGWATMITCISRKVHPLEVDSVLLTVLGFTISLALSFRSSTAYERYGEGRKYWAQLTLHSRMLGHLLWIHGNEREGELGKQDLLAKLSAINLILGFCQSVKYKLRHSIEYDYEDLGPLIGPLDTFAKRARGADQPASEYNREHRKKKNPFKTWGEFLGVPFASSNPQKEIKKARLAKKHHGNLPYEILNNLGSFIEESLRLKTLDNPVILGQIYTTFFNMMDAFGGCERVLQTPLPLAYNILISQITWMYILILPFQLVQPLGWVAIPGTTVAAYIILGLGTISREIEEPFGRDVNDLDLDRYCKALQYDLNVLTATPKSERDDWIYSDQNKPLWPYSTSGYNRWQGASMSQIRKALADKPTHQYKATVVEGTYPQSDVRMDEKSIHRNGV